MASKPKTSYSIVWRPLAESDLENIIDYIAQDSAAQAAKFGEVLRDSILPLTQYPKMGRTGRPGLPAFVRELVVHHNYIVLYRVQEHAPRTVEILRVKHVAQRIP